MRRQQLTEAQIAALFDPPTDWRELVRHCTLSEADTAMIRRCRGDHSRLGYALMLCYLRYPGRPLRINERPSAALISFVAEQIDVRPELIDDYLISDQNRRRHAAELQDRLRLRPFGRLPASELAGSLLPHAIESDRLALLAGLVIQECRQRGIVVPSPRSLERFCVELRHQARREIERRLYDRRDLTEARRDLAAWLAKWSGKYSKLTGWVEDNIDETLTFYRLPRQHRAAWRVSAPAVAFSVCPLCYKNWPFVSSGQSSSIALLRGSARHTIPPPAATALVWLN